MTHPLQQINVRHPIVAELRKRARFEYETADAMVFIADVDFELAQKLIECRPDCQRTIRTHKVSEYAQKMDEGKWAPEEQHYIALDARLNLVNGQHRCLAVMSSKTGYVMPNTTIKILRKDAKTEDINVDTETPRTVTDFVKWKLGENIKASISSGIVHEKFNFNRHRFNTSTKPERARIVAECEYLDDIRSISKIHHAPAGVIAAAVRCMRANREDAVKFFDHVMRNDHVIDGVYSFNAKHLATWLLDSKHKKYSGDTFFRECVYRAITAWNDHRRGKKPSKLPPYSAEWSIPEAML